MRPNTTMTKPLHILIVEDSDDDVLLLLRELGKAGYDVISRRVETAEQMRAALGEGIWDLVISDYVLPRFSGTGALQVMKESGLDLPFIIVSGNIGEEIAVKAMKAGAHDYLMKGNLKRLTPAVERELEEAEIRRQRKRAETDLLRQNRLYSVLSKVNEAIFRKRDRKTLFDEVCRIMAEPGGFRLAWIGILDPSTRVVNRVASCGATKYLDGLRVMAADVPEGRGPTGRAIAEGHHVINVDFETNEHLVPWRERARKNDIRSSSAFPLFAGGTVVGALTIYADKPHFFTDEETALLTTLANNLSFALEAITVEEKRRTMEATLRESYAEIQDLYNNAPCGYHSLDRNGLIIRINDTELKWLGCQREDVEGKKHMYDFYTPEGREVFKETFPKFMRTGSITDLELELKRKDGTVMQVLLNATAVRDPNGAFLMSRSTIFDISARRRAERDIRLLAAALESAGDAVVITEPGQGRIRYVNAAFEHITGYSSEEVEGRTLHFLDSGRHDEAFYSAIRETMIRDGRWQGRIISKKKDGTHYFEDCAISAVRGPSGAIANYVSIRRDVTERLRLEAVAEAVNAMEGIGYIFAGLRHEIGNPVNSAKSILSVLEAKLDATPPPRVHEFLQRAIDEIGRVEKLLHLFRTFSLYETPEIIFLDTNAVLDDLFRLVEVDFSRRGISLSREIGPGAERMRADQRALQQVLLNILTNAADALDGQLDPRIDISAEIDGSRVLLRVRDNGKGFSDESLRNAFRPFYTSKPKGTGLGLVIVRKLITRMGGTIGIESKAGEGTTVNIHLEATHG
jgi:PAS domain S-box-containing protein